MLRVNRIIEKTAAEGPGIRFCIWVQGCHNQCKGCFATETWDEKKGFLLSEENVIAQIDAVKEEIEGVTFLGGEPFEQAESLALIGAWVQTIGLNVITFTGKTYDWLQTQKCAGIQKLLQVTDLLIDGEYKEDLQDFSRPLVGSSNQRFFFLSSRYCMKDIMELNNIFEVRVNKDGKVVVNGMGDIEKLKNYIKSYY